MDPHSAFDPPLGSACAPTERDPQGSYVQGVRDPPLIDDTIGERLARTAREHPAAEALVSLHQGLRWTYGELDGRTDAFASGLLALGLQPGDRVGVWAPNCAEWAVAQFATARAGLVLVSINPAYRTSELEHVLNKVDCAALITAARFKSSDYLQMLRALAPELDEARSQLRSERFPALRHVITLGPETFAGCRPFEQVCDLGELAGPEPLAVAMALVRPDDAVNIQFTERHDGFAEGGHPLAQEPPEQRILGRGGDWRDARFARLHSGAAVSLLRHGDGQPRLHGARRDDGLPGPELRAPLGFGGGGHRTL